MKLARICFDKFYDLIKLGIFRITKKDPEVAHNLFINFCRTLHLVGLENIVLDCPENKRQLPFQISNAAGFNKNAEIPLTVLKALGFDRVVIGTVTYDFWKGNQRPRIMRFPKTGSLVNWMGLPGVGAKRVAETLASYGDHKIPMTINLMSTPEKKRDELLRDLESTVSCLKDLSDVDRWELNISCPNTSNSSGKCDARQEYQAQLGDMLKVLEAETNSEQEIYLKVSPDLSEKGVAQILEVSSQHDVKGFTTANTTTHHNPEFIEKSPGKGGASGNAVYNKSLDTQRLFNRKTCDTRYKLIACGGINSLERVQERLDNGASEIQIYTPFIFQGPRFIRRLRKDF